MSWLGWSGCCVLAFVWGILRMESAVTAQSHDRSEGYFWQITDIHYDPEYPFLMDPPVGCLYRDDRILYQPPGKFGNYLCDSSWHLAVSAIRAMAAIAPNPDFILWTGDNIPHLPPHLLTQKQVFSELNNLTQVMKTAFPNTLILPTLGNHDSWVPNVIPSDSTYYTHLLRHSGWDMLLDQDLQHQFEQGGFYANLLNDKVLHIGLNTMLWYRKNNLVDGQPDPALHFQWLEKHLASAYNNGRRVLLTGHVPPGVPGRRATTLPWLEEPFNKQFLQLMDVYSSIIIAAIFAHEHSDGFRIVYDKTGKPAIPMYLAPSVTPVFGKNPGQTGNNPAIRLYKYNPSSGEMLDFTQYYLDLVTANRLGVANWSAEYRFTTAYGLPDISAGSLHKLLDSFKVPPSGNFVKYHRHNTVSYHKEGECNVSCMWRHICAAEFVDFQAYKNCMISHGNDIFDENIKAPNANHALKVKPKNENITQYMIMLTFVLVAVVVILIIMMGHLCRKHRYHVVLHPGNGSAGFVLVDTSLWTKLTIRKINRFIRSTLMKHSPLPPV